MGSDFDMRRLARLIPGGARRSERDRRRAFSLLVEKADVRRDSKNPAGAAELYREALGLFPGATGIRTQYANALKDSGNFEEALRNYKLVLDYAPNDWDAYLQLGRNYMLMGQRDQAIACFREVVRINPAATAVELELVRLEFKAESNPERGDYGIRNGEMYKLLTDSPAFDERYYRLTNPSLAPDADAIVHYLTLGYRHHVRTSEEFDGAVYYARVPEVRGGGIPPLVHAIEGQLLQFGRAPAHAPIHWVGEAVPDVIVNLERLRAESFAFRHGLREANHEAAHLEAAARSLASEVAPEREPVVSVIIPVYGQTLWCLNCLDSLHDHKSRYSFEIIIYDDASPSEMNTVVLELLPWIRYVRGAKNLGFLGACNAASGSAKGRYLVFLNSDTRVCEGWLDELIGTFEIKPEAGLVGSKLLYEDGTLQEAGCIVWKDGSAWNYGRNEDPNRPEYCFARKVDYCSGAAIALPADLWRKLEGFDVHYSPAYYEDVDLAFRVKAAGREVWYQSLARVIHFEGKTHGTDVSTGVKSYQAVNARKFYDRWSEVLTSHRPNGDHPSLEADRSHPLRVLAIDAETPTPDRDAGSVMTFKLLQILQRLGWQVVFMPMHDVRYRPTYTDNLARTGIPSLIQPQVGSLREYLRSEGQSFEMILGFRVTVVDDVMQLLRSSLPKARILFHDIDLHYLRMEREAKLLQSEVLRLKALDEKARELSLCAIVDCVIVPSEDEKKLLKQEIGLEHCVVYPYTSDVVETPGLDSSRRNLIFVGGFRHHPNIDAAQMLIQEIWPRLRELLDDDVKLFIVGPNPPAELVALASDRVIVTGFVEDLAPVLETCRVFVAPLRYGAGLKGKVVTALSHGVPCVGTSIAVEGMYLEHNLNVLVADEPEAIAKEISQLYVDDARWAALREAGHAFVAERYSWSAGEVVASEAIAIAEKVWLARKLSPSRRGLATLNKELLKPSDGRALALT